MNNKKCSFCGFINFASAEACRKCEAVLAPLGQASSDESPQAGYYGQPAQAYAPAGMSPYQPYPTKSKTPLLKGFLYVFVGLVVLSALSGGGVAFLKHSKVSWKPVHVDGSDLTVSMPGNPLAGDQTVTPTQAGPMKKSMYSSFVTGQGSAFYCVVEFTNGLPADIPTQKVLEGELQNVLTATNTTLVSKKGVDLDGYPGLEFETTPPSNLSPRMDKGFGKLILVNNRLYLLSLMVRDDTDLFTKKDTFLNPALSH